VVGGGLLAWFIRKTKAESEDSSRKHKEWMYWFTESSNPCRASSEHQVMCSKCGVTHEPDSELNRWKRERQERLDALEKRRAQRQLAAENRTEN
jgi:hypothetical protein